MEKSDIEIVDEERQLFENQVRSLRLSEIGTATTKHFKMEVFVSYEIRAEARNAYRSTESL